MVYSWACPIYPLSDTESTQIARTPAEFCLKSGSSAYPADCVKQWPEMYRAIAQPLIEPVIAPLTT